MDNGVEFKLCYFRNDVSGYCENYLLDYKLVFQLRHIRYDIAEYFKKHFMGFLMVNQLLMKSYGDTLSGVSPFFINKEKKTWLLVIHQESHPK